MWLLEFGLFLFVFGDVELCWSQEVGGKGGMSSYSTIIHSTNTHTYTHAYVPRPGGAELAVVRSGGHVHVHERLLRVLQDAALPEWYTYIYMCVYVE